MAENKNGKFLSEKMDGVDKKYNWQCNQNHNWQASYSSVRKGTWCPNCSGNIPITLKKAKQLAKNNRGKFLSNKIGKAKEKYKWQCEKGHIWTAIYNNIYKGSWCPYCKKSKTENKCRKILENLFQTEFPSIKAKWIRNPKTGHLLELDGYSAELNIAFEYNGEQHYKLHKFNNNDLIKLYETQYRDSIKISKCKEKNVKLLIIDKCENLSEDKIKEKIINILNDNNIIIN